jgi:hypothetical protein
MEPALDPIRTPDGIFPRFPQRMNFFSGLSQLVVVGTLSLVADATVAAQNVTTYRYDEQVSGINPKETLLTPANVNVSTFGEIFSDPVDGQVFAQPLYVRKVSIPGKGFHNVVYIATAHDSVYAFDADAGGDPLWVTSFLAPDKGITSVPQPDVVSGDIQPEIGIIGTPVIDRSTATLYVVAKTKETGRGDGHSHYVQRLHALDITSGAERFGGPHVIGDTTCDTAGTWSNNYDYNLGLAPDTPAVKGHGDGSVNGMVYFNALRANQRASLALAHGVVYVAWSSHGDMGPYHGWLIGFDAKTLKPLPNCIFCATPDGGEGGMWQSGCGPLLDRAGSLFISTANGSFSGNTDGRNWAQTFFRFNTGAGLSTAKLGKTFDYFSPFNEKALSDGDLDVGTGGMCLIDPPRGPVPHLIVGTTKEGTYYVLNCDNMGQFDAAKNHIVQRFETPDNRELMSTPIFFNNALFYNRNGEDLRARVLVNGQFADKFNRTADSFGARGGGPVISANGTKDGIVWMLSNVGPAELTAYSADALAAPIPAAPPPATGPNPPPVTAPPAPQPVKPLYTARLLDRGIKFTHPLVVDGKVYACGATKRGNRIVSAHLCVFGILPTTAGAAKPAMPEHLQASSDEPGAVSLSWVNHDPNVHGFVIERGAGGGAPFAQVGTAGGRESAFRDNTVAGGTPYQYRVTAVNKNGSSAPTPAVNVKSHDYICEDSLVAYWSFDESGGGVAHDVTGRGHDGKIVGEVNWSDGILDSPALNFHGTGNARSHIEVAQQADLDFSPGQSFSIVAWARPASLQNRWEGVVTKLRQTGAGWLGVYTAPDGHWAFRGSEDGHNLAGGSVIPNSWQQVVVAQDGPARTRTLYVNGVQVANAHNIAPDDGVGTIWIGQANADEEAFAGSIDDVRVYGRALGADDVKRLFGSYLPTICFKEPADNAVVTGKKEVQFVALASAPAPGTAIDEVRFFEQANQLGSAGGSPCYWTWHDIPPGDHVVTARAVDSNGNITESPPLHVKVVPPPPAPAPPAPPAAPEPASAHA